MARKQKQEAALTALMQTSTLSEAAEQAGIDRKTLYRYIHTDSDFAKAYKEDQAASSIARHERLQQASARAIDTLLTLMEDDSQNPNARCKAAQIVLEEAAKQRSLISNGIEQTENPLSEIFTAGDSTEGFRKLLQMVGE